MNMQEHKRFLTISEAAEFLHVSEISLRRWTNSGKLRCFRVGGRSERRFLIDDLLAFMQSMDVHAEPLQAVETEAINDTGDAERHISLFFRDQEEKWQLLRPYLVDYLSSGAPAFYLQHRTSSELLMQQLRAEELPLDKLIARGLLRVLPPSQTYLLPGKFDAEWMLEFLEMTIQAALEAGHKRILMTGELTSIQGAPGVEQMAHYEAMLNPLVDRYPEVTIVCQYDLKSFTGDVILDALMTHPSILVSSGLAPGFYGIGG